MLSRFAPPSILITVEPPGNAWPHVDTLVRELSALGIEVTVAAITPLRPGQRIEYAAIPGVELLACPTPASSPAEHLALRGRIADWLLAVEEMLNPDVVHLTGYLHAGLPWCGKVLVAGFPGAGAAYGRLGLEQRRACRSAFLYGLKGADLVVAQSETMMSALVRHFAIPPGRVIRDGRDPGRFMPGLKEPVVVSAGTQREDASRRSVLEEAASGLAWPVVVAGEQVDAAGHAVQLTGVSSLGRLHLAQLLPWFKRASIFVALTAEGPGTWLPEAALTGCTLVLGDTAALRERWSGAAVFVAPGDADALTASLRALMGDRRLRESLGTAARRRAMQHPARAMAKAYAAAYADLIDARAPNQFAQERLGSDK